MTQTNEIDLELNYHKNQAKIFFEDNSRYKVIAKGRRFGLTRGFATYIIEKMTEGVTPVLWIDTIYGNIERYVERYFIPVLKKLPKNLWKYRTNRNDLKIGNSVCDFRSADNPENIEGFGYALIVINEAGIVLKNRSLWTESILPMILDYKAKVLIGGTPKGKRVKRTNEKHLFYELYEKCQKSNVKCKENPPSSQGEATPFEKGGMNPPSSQGEATPFGKGGMNPPSVQGTDTPFSKGGIWESFNFSSYDNPLLDKEEIDELVKEISPVLRDQEIYGKFVDAKSAGIIKSDWWQYYENESELFTQRVYKKVQSWDTAFKKNQENDYSVCTTWLVAQNGYYLIDMWRGRVEFPELKKKVIELYDREKPNEILIEDKASGQSLIQELQRNTRLPVKVIKVDSDKISRVHTITPLIEAGKVIIPREKHWVKTFTDECEDFPNGEFDDIVDTMSQFLINEKGLPTADCKGIIHLPRKGKIGRASCRERV